MSGADTTAEAIERAMDIYREKVLDERYFNVETGFYDYPSRITRQAVLKLAKLKSRSTILAKHHLQTRMKLDALIDDLKMKTGKVGAEEEAAAAESGKIPASEISVRGAATRSRIDSLLGTIGRLTYRILVLEQENASLRADGGRKVVDLNSAKKPAKGR